MRPMLLVASIAGVVITLANILPLMAGLRLLAVLIWWAMPGVVLARRLYGRQPGGWAAALLAGPVWGYALSSLVLLGFWVAGVRNFSWLMLAPLPAAVLVWPARRLANTLTVPAFTRREIAAWAFVILTIVAIVGRPYARIGSEVPEGRAYRAYFTADFVWAMAIVAEVSKGDVLPKNPYYNNDSLHYYWLMHLLPAVEYHSAPKASSIQQLLLVNALWTALMFGGFLYFLVRHFVDRAWAAALACGGVLFCSSFEGTDRLLYAWRQIGSLAYEPTLNYLRTLNIDAVANWSYQGMKVDGLHRLLLYQPQHQVGYVLGFSALLLLAQARDCSRAALLFLSGVFLGLSLLFSSFAAGIFAVMAAAYEAVRLIQARQWKAFALSAVAAVVPFGAAFALSTALQYVDPVTGGRPPLTLGVNPLAAHRVAWTFWLNFGPVLMVAAAGFLIGLWRGMLPRLVPLVIALAVSTVFYFLVDVPDVQNVYAGLNIGKLMFIALTPLCAIALDAFWSPGGWIRWTTSATVAAIAVAALPTVLIDIYNTQDVWNRAMGPGFRWTVILSPGEIEGLNWIRRSTAKDARVQVEPEIRGRDTWTWVTGFGERRMAGGIPLGMVPLAKYEKISAQIKKEIYQSTSAHEAYERSLDFCIDYLVIGGPERTAYAPFQKLVDESPDLFRPVFRNNALAVYAVPRHDRARSGCS